MRILRMRAAPTHCVATRFLYSRPMPIVDRIHWAPTNLYDLFDALLCAYAIATYEWSQMCFRWCVHLAGPIRTHTHTLYGCAGRCSAIHRYPRYSIDRFGEIYEIFAEICYALRASFDISAAAAPNAQEAIRRADTFRIVCALGGMPASSKYRLAQLNNGIRDIEWNCFGEIMAELFRLHHFSFPWLDVWPCRRANEKLLPTFSPEFQSGFSTCRALLQRQRSMQAEPTPCWRLSVDFYRVYGEASHSHGHIFYCCRICDVFAIFLHSPRLLLLRLLSFSPHFQRLPEEPSKSPLFPINLLVFPRKV